MARAARTCARCPAIVTNGSVCQRCQRASDRARGTSTERGYNSAGHARFRAAVLARDPVCVLCHKTWANTADHWPVSRRELIAQHLDPDNPTRGRGLCKRCHDRETATNQPGGWNTGHRG